MSWSLDDPTPAPGGWQPSPRGASWGHGAVCPSTLCPPSLQRKRCHGTRTVTRRCSREPRSRRQSSTRGRCGRAIFTPRCVWPVSGAQCPQETCPRFPAPTEHGPFGVRTSWVSRVPAEASRPAGPEATDADLGGRHQEPRAGPGGERRPGASAAAGPPLGLREARGPPQPGSGRRLPTRE